MQGDIVPSQADAILAELQQNRTEKSLKIYQKLLTCNIEDTVTKWQLILQELLDQIAKATERNQRVLLTSQSFICIFSKLNSTPVEITKHLEDILNLSDEKLTTLNRNFIIADVELFKLNSIHGYLLAKRANIYTPELLTQCLDQISRHCMTYTRHVYYAFKLLISWLERSRDVDLWATNDTENKLEAIIFSNWDNSIDDITRMNATQVFPVYLTIMRKKYPGFLDYTFQTCMDNLSWMTTTKHLILAEICRCWDSLPPFHDTEIRALFHSLTKSHLKHAATKLYISLLDKMTNEMWMSTIMQHVHFYAKKWETEKNLSTLQVLWELWLKPTISKFGTKLHSKFKSFFFRNKLFISQSYLTRYSAELRITWRDLAKGCCNSSETNLNRNLDYWTSDRTTGLPPILDHAEECVRLNVFLTLCRRSDFKYLNENWLLPQHFLYYNRGASTSEFRKGICEGMSLLIRSADPISRYASNSLKQLCKIIYLFIRDSVEPGTNYQQKILALKLFDTTMQHDDCKEYFDSRQTFVTLMMLITDPIEEISILSCNLIKKYLPLIEDYKPLVETGLRCAQSQLPGAGRLLQLFSNTELFAEEPLHEMLYNYTIKSFTVAKKDPQILITCSKTGGLLTAMLDIDFSDAMKTEIMGVDFIQKFLDLCEDIMQSFLAIWSPKETDTPYSLSFEEMGITISKIIDSKPPIDAENPSLDANQDIFILHHARISTISSTLKTVCELLGKIATLPIGLDNVRRSLDLIVSSLMKYRHRGITDAAGEALASAVRHLTAVEESSQLFDVYLDKLLSLDSSERIDVTRRGAGLSTMFHKLTANDRTPSRRLLHAGLRRLLELLRQNEAEVPAEANQDCPRARQLHCLRALVADRSLSDHLVGYLQEIAIMCFEHLQSSKWAIRNASLQLFGAVVPRIVGQLVESKHNSGFGYSVNHFVTHYPDLSRYVLERLKNPSALGVHGNIVSVLALFTKMSVGGCEFTDYSAAEYVENVKNYLRVLFGHSVGHVRFLAAKAYAAFTPVQSILTELGKMAGESLGGQNRNFIHGCLLAKICLLRSAKFQGIFESPLNECRKEIVEIIRDFDLKRIQLMFNYCREDLGLCYVIESTFLQSFSMLPMADSSEDLPVSNSEFLDILERAAKRMIIGGSEFILRLFEFNSIFVNIENVNLDFLEKCLCSEHNDIRTYFSKYLSPKLSFTVDKTTEFFQKRYDLFKKLIDCLYDESLSRFIPVAKLIMRIFKFYGNNRLLYLKSLDNEICQQLNKLIVSGRSIFHDYNRGNKLFCLLVSQLKKYQISDENLQHFVLNQIDNNLKKYPSDEQTSLWAIECLRNLNISDLDPEYRCQMYITILALFSNQDYLIRKEAAQEFSWLMFVVLFNEENKPKNFDSRFLKPIKWDDEFKTIMPRCPEYYVFVLCSVLMQMYGKSPNYPCSCIDIFDSCEKYNGVKSNVKIFNILHYTFEHEKIHLQFEPQNFLKLFRWAVSNINKFFQKFTDISEDLAVDNYWKFSKEKFEIHDFSRRILSDSARQLIGTKSRRFYN